MLSSSVHGIFQGRLLEWVVIYFSKEIFLNLGSNLCISIFCIAGRFFTSETLGKPAFEDRAFQKVILVKQSHMDGP